MNLLKSSLVLFLAAAPLSAQVATQATAAAPTKSAVKPFSPVDSARFMALGKRAAAFMIKHQADSLLAIMDADVAEKFGGVEGLTQNFASIDEKAGSLNKLLLEKLTRRNGLPQFWYEGDFANFTDEPVVLRFVFTEEGKLVGMGFSPKSKAMFDS